ncbi:unnamed protein product [Calypogeia fissa]
MALTNFVSSIVFTILCSSVAHSSKLDPVRTVFEFPKNTFVENLAVRSNGQILVSVITTPQLFLVNSVQVGEPTLIHNFTSALGVAGIAEYDEDVFAVITGNFSFVTDDVGPGTWAVWSVDLRGVESQPDNTLYPPPQIHKIADVNEARSLNGISLLSKDKGTILVGDVSAGNIIRLDVESGDYKVVINNTFTLPAPATISFTFGVNGLHVRDGSVFLTNTGKSIFVEIPINEDGTPAENGTIIAHTLASIDEFDDFTFDRKGNAYLVTGRGNSVERISRDGRREVIIAGSLNSTMIAEPTSAAFGRGECDKNVLYVTTAGGFVTPVDGTIVIGGQLLAITTDAE